MCPQQALQSWSTSLLSFCERTYTVQSQQGYNEYKQSTIIKLQGLLYIT